MERDPQVRACLTTKRLAVLSESVEVHPGQDSAEGKRLAALVEEQVDSIPGGWAGLVTGALDALAMGFAAGEYLWTAEGLLSAVRWHDPRRFGFVVGETGDVVGLEVLDAGATWPRERFAVYSYQSRYGNPYGESDLVAAYRPYALKDETLRMWLVGLDKWGVPSIIATVPGHWTQAEMDSLTASLGKIQSETALAVPEGVVINPALDAGRVEPARAYVTATEYFDRQIARAILGGELTSTGAAGSHALGTVHADVAQDWIQALRSDLAECLLTGQVARTICTMWAGPNAPCPVVKFPNLSAAELAGRRELVKLLLDGSVVAPSESWLRSWLGVPEGTAADRAAALSRSRDVLSRSRDVAAREARQQQDHRQGEGGGGDGEH